MPFRDYKCDKCHNIIEKRESIDAPNQQKCDIEKQNCDGNGNLKRIVSPVGEPKFKGTGFYETDYN